MDSNNLGSTQFDALLRRLDDNREKAGEKYEFLRKKLVMFFQWNSILSIKCGNWLYSTDRAETADRAEIKESPLSMPSFGDLTRNQQFAELWEGRIPPLRQMSYFLAKRSDKKPIPDFHALKACNL